MTRSNPRWREQHGAETSPQHMSSGLNSGRPALQNPGTKDVFDSIVKGRKSWKTLRGGEVVWPPELEAALLEGLENYQPDDSRETRLLGRFPLRNRFISDYILEKTGKHRTPKQVGSRLQQLRDTCGGKELLSLLSPCRVPGRTPSNALYHRSSSSLHSDSSEESSSGPNSPTEYDGGMSPWNNSGGTSTSVICIDILPDHPSHSSSPVSFGSFGYPPAEADHNGEVRLSHQPRPIRSIDPTLTFVAYTSISASALFNVSVNGQSVHTELVPLSLRPVSQTVSAPDLDIEEAYIYSTTLVPNYWRTIVGSDDPTRYSIRVEVFKESPSSTCTMYSAIFKFRFASAPGASYPRTHTSLPFPGAVGPGGAHPAPHAGYLDSLGTASIHMPAVLDAPKSPSYHFPSFDSWDMAQMSPTSETGSSTGQSFRSHSSQGYASSRSNSLSPTNAHFPSMYNYHS